MASQVTLLLTCMLFSKALSLICQQCLSSSDPCEQINCTEQCLTWITSVSSSDGDDSYDSIKSCGVSGECETYSINLGIVKSIVSGKCCNTDLCNAGTLQASPKQDPNGRKCYTCVGNDCSRTLNCEGTEDRCITLTAQYLNYRMSMKGCVSKHYCVSYGSTSVPGIGMSKLECCEGNLCNSAGSNAGSSSGNSAESFTLSLLLMMVPLLSSILFY